MTQRLHILGICGTFMGGLAVLAREQGWRVSGCDARIYPPMSDQLAALGIDVHEGYDARHLPGDALIVVGNALSRGNPALEAVLDRGLPYTSGPQWLAEHVLAGRWVLAVAGTHGKTTASSMLAWLLEDAGMQPGFLIGGVPLDFARSARLGGGRFFVVEADEYDTAFFDKRAKFVHYRPRTLVINNLEFDHADIYSDIAAIQRQFHHLLRCVPASGQLITPSRTVAIEDMLALGCWTPRVTMAVEDAAADWRGVPLEEDGRVWRLHGGADTALEIRWAQRGRHNIANALGAIAAARHVGVRPAQAAASLQRFQGVRRRLELRGEVAGIRVYDDFAHHPSAIAATLATVRAAPRRARTFAVIEPRSNSMRLGEHRAHLAACTQDADRVFWYRPPGLEWSLDDIARESSARASIHADVAELIASLVAEASAGDDIVIMSNGAFGAIHQRLVDALSAHYSE